METTQNNGAPRVATRQLLKKLTVKDIAGKVSLEKLVDHNRANQGAPLWLATLIGLASAYTTGQSQHGPYVKFQGQFEGTNVETGEVKRSGACILPGAAPDLIYGALKSLGDAGGSVEVALRIGVKRSDSPVGYDYVIEQIAEITQSDPIGAMKARLGIAAPAQAALAAPAAPPAQAPASEPAQASKDNGKRRAA